MITKINIKVPKASEIDKNTLNNIKESEAIEDAFQNSIRIQTIKFVKEKIEHFSNCGYYYTICNFNSLTKAEVKFFEDLGYKVYNKGDKQDGRQSWDLDWKQKE